MKAYLVSSDNLPSHYGSPERLSDFSKVKWLLFGKYGEEASVSRVQGTGAEGRRVFSSLLSVWSGKSSETSLDFSFFISKIEMIVK